MQLKRRLSAVLAVLLAAALTGPAYAGITGDTDQGWTIFDPSSPPPGQPGAFRYGPSLIKNADGTMDMWTCSPGYNTDPSQGNWDYIRYRRSPDGGRTWGAENVTLKPHPGSADVMSTCDPGVVRFGGYYYLSYTSTAHVSGTNNNVFAARSAGPNGPWEKWNGSGWGGNPQPIVTYTGPKGYYGAGESSLIVKDGKLYVYYSWWSIDDNKRRINQTRLSTAPVTDPNWPAALAYKGIAINRSLDNCDSTDHKWVPSMNKFIAVQSCKRFTADAFLQLWESADGLTYRPATLPRMFVQPGAHNAGISGNELGHFDAAGKNVVGYAYGTTWAFWYTAMQPFTLKDNSLPATPRIIATVPGDEKATLHFQTTGAPGETYTIRYGTASGSYTKTVSGITKSPHTITGLTNGTRHFLTVAATSSGGTSPNAPQESAMPLAYTAAPGAAVTASSALSGWPASAAIDGDPGTTWSSNGHTAQREPEWIRLDTGASRLIGRVTLTPRQHAELGWPVDNLHGTSPLKIQVSEDDNRWATADVTGTRLDAPYPKFVYELKRPLRGRYVRAHASVLGPDEWTYPQNYYFQLGEMEAEQVPGGANASSQLTGWAATKLLDGDLDTVWSSNTHTTEAATEWASLDLGATTTVTGAVLTPRSGGMGFPKDFTFQSSTDGTTWTNIPGGSHTDHPAVGSSPVRFKFAAPVKTRYLRLHATKLTADSNGNYHAQLAEFATQTAPIRTATASSQISWLPASQAADNDPATVYSSTGHTGADATEWIKVDMGSESAWSHVTLAPRGLGGGNDPYGFPVDFELQSSSNGENWMTVPGHKYRDFYPPGLTTQQFPFTAPVTARFFRIHATKLRADSAGTYHLQLGEFTVHP